MKRGLIKKKSRGACGKGKFSHFKKRTQGVREKELFGRFSTKGDTRRIFTHWK